MGKRTDKIFYYEYRMWKSASKGADVIPVLKFVTGFSEINIDINPRYVPVMKLLLKLQVVSD